MKNNNNSDDIMNLLDGNEDRDVEEDNVSVITKGKNTCFSN